jgi:hypothetical protein
MRILRGYFTSRTWLFERSILRSIWSAGVFRRFGFALFTTRTAQLLETQRKRRNEKRRNTDALQTLRDARAARSVWSASVFRRFRFHFFNVAVKLLGHMRYLSTIGPIRLSLFFAREQAE